MTTEFYDRLNRYNVTYFVTTEASGGYVTNPPCQNVTQDYHVCTVTSCIDLASKKMWKVDIGCDEVGIALLVTLFTLLAVGIFTGNLVIIYVMTASNASRKPHGFVKCSLAFADLFQGLFAVPASLYTYIHFYFLPGPYSGKLIQEAAQSFFVAYRVNIFFFILSNSLSLFSLIVLSLDRFLAICYPLRYHAGELMTRRRVLSTVAITWLLCIVMGITLEELLAKEFLGAIRKEYYDSVIRAISIIFGSCYFITIILLAITVRNSFKTIRSMQKLNASVSVAAREGLDVKKTNIEVRFAKTVTLMVFFFTMSVLPYVGLKLSNDDQTWYLELIFEYLLYTNSLWNIFIYSFRCRDFQASMCRLPYTKSLLRVLCKSKLEKWATDEVVNCRSIATAQYTIPLSKNKTTIEMERRNGNTTCSPSCTTLASNSSNGERENDKLMQLNY
uniref:Alpha-2A adrenergic receptor-like n=1 Tax=Phallusia mammillata TaxID=59560 RepID=A0A6F9D5E6_9ASCI|nr:alpha-2A adrenergic receptor-like [Phallusia mammillata]